MLIMNNTIIVKYTYFGNDLVAVVSIDNERMEEVYYFDYEDFASNIADLVELCTGAKDYVLQKI